MGRKKVYIHKVATVKFSKTHLKNPKKTCKPNNHNLIHD